MRCANRNPAAYDLGDAVELFAEFTDPVTGEFLDPIGAIYCAVLKPDGSETTYTLADINLSKESTGVYKCVIEADQPGQWFYRWAGITQAEEENTFYVKDRVVTITV